MPKERQATLDAFAKIPGLEGLMPLLEKLPTAAEWDEMMAWCDEQLESDYKALLDYNIDDNPPVRTAKKVRKAPAPAPAPVPATSLSGTQLIGIRIPKVVVAAFKAWAKEMGVPYQTLMNRELRLISARLKSPSAPV